MFYMFEYDEINCCYACPLLYDMIHCDLEGFGEHTIGEYTDYDDNMRPKWCQLKEASELEKHYQSLLNALNDAGISAFLTADGKWHVS